MTIRYPAPLTPGDLIGVTAPSAGVADALRPRLDHSVDLLRRRGFDVRLGNCLDGTGQVSAPASDRAAELTAMLVDPTIRAVVPPWGGELAIDLIHLLDWDAIAAAPPTWLVGYSDISTLLLALTIRTGTASLHGQNLLDTPYEVPAPLLSWIDVVTAPTGSHLQQGASQHHRSGGYDDYATHPTISAFTLDTPGGWTRLDSPQDVTVTGRLIGGCLETISHLAGTPYGNLPGFAREHAPDGLIVYVEAAEATAVDIGRRLHGLRLAGWFDDANAILLGRTHAPDVDGYTQQDAALDALGGLGVPIIADVDCGHVPPHLALVNGAHATVTWTSTAQDLSQTLT